MSTMVRRLVAGKQLWLTLGVVAATLVLVRLGFWQLQRRVERIERNTSMFSRANQPPLELDGPLADPAAVEYRRVVVTGTFDYRNEVVLLGRARGETPGVHLITPLRIAGSDQGILVDRGWIPYEQREPANRAQFRGPPGARIEGRLWLAPGDPASAEPGSASTRLDSWTTVNVGRIQAQLPYRLLPVYVEQGPAAGENGLPWRGRQITLDQGPHLSYAIQWFSFAAILLVGYLAYILRMPEPVPAPSGATE
jgi:surfeit locus 1 family protein